MDPTKLAAIDTWKPPTSVKEVHSFLGFANFYRKFIPNYSNIVTPLTFLTRKDQHWIWSSLQQRAFDHLHKIFFSAPILIIPDTSRPFSLMTDASLLAAGAVLMQRDVNGDLHPCAYFSKMFSLTERNYNIYDRKLLAVILALTEWKHYFQGTPFAVSIITDHKNLSYIKDSRKLSCQQAQWALFLLDFHIEWIVTPGTQMGPADALSRKDTLDTALDNQDTSIVPNPVIINALDLALSTSIAQSTPSDPLILRILAGLKDGTPLLSRSTLSNWHYDNGHLYFKGQMFMPPSSQSALLHAIHSSPLSGYMGIFHTKSILERDYWWLGLASFVKNFIDGYVICQQNKVNTHPTTLPLCPISSTSSLPFKQLSVDLITDLPPSSTFDSILVMVDHGLTKGVILAPCCKTIDVAGITQLFFDNVFKCFGLHDTLISDCGPQFASAFTRELARLLKYDVKLSTAYHPQTDRQTKQANQELETYLCIFCANNPQSWAQSLSSTEFHHNSAPHSSTKKSPFSILYGYEPRTFPPLGKTFLPALENRLSSLDETRKEALATHESVTIGTFLSMDLTLFS